MFQIDHNKCIRCGLCVKDCPQGCLSLGETGVTFVPEGCMKCDHCVCICPKGAITAEGKEIENYMPYDSASCQIDADRLQRFMETRRSIRHFTEKDVTEEVLKELLRAGQVAPTAVNSRDVRFTVIHDQMDEFTEMVWDGYEKFIEGMHLDDAARLARWKQRIVDRNADPKNDRIVFGAKAAIMISSARATDAVIAATYLELKAHAMGLGALFSGYCVRSVKAYDDATDGKFSEWLGIGDYTLYTTLLIGYPEVKYQRAAGRDELDVIMK